MKTILTLTLLALTLGLFGCDDNTAGDTAHAVCSKIEKCRHFDKDDDYQTCYQNLKTSLEYSGKCQDEAVRVSWCAADLACRDIDEIDEYCKKETKDYSTCIKHYYPSLDVDDLFDFD